MKRFFVLPLVILSLCGCSKPETTRPTLNNITFTAQIDYNECRYVCNVDVSDDIFNLVILEPKEIKDLILKIDKTSLVAEFMGVKYALDINSFPQCSLIRIVYDVFNDAANKECSFKNENCKIVGKVSEYDYEFLFSPSGLPLSLEIKNLNLKIIFNNVIVKQGELK